MFRVEILLCKPTLSHSPKWELSFSFNPPTPLLLILSQLMTLPQSSRKKQKQSDRNITCHRPTFGPPAPAAFVLLLSGKCLWLLSKADKPSTYAWDSISCLLKDVIIIIICLSPASLVSPSESSPPAHKHFLVSHIPHHGTNSSVVYSPPAPHFTFPSCLNWALPKWVLSPLTSMLPNWMVKCLPLFYLMACGAATFSMTTELFFLKCHLLSASVT